MKGIGQTQFVCWKEQKAQMFFVFIIGIRSLHCARCLTGTNTTVYEVNFWAIRDFQ